MQLLVVQCWEPGAVGRRSVAILPSFEVFCSGYFVTLFRVTSYGSSLFRFRLVNCAQWDNLDSPPMCLD